MSRQILLVCSLQRRRKNHCALPLKLIQQSQKHLRLVCGVTQQLELLESGKDEEQGRGREKITVFALSMSTPEDYGAGGTDGQLHWLRCILGCAGQAG